MSVEPFVKRAWRLTPIQPIPSVTSKRNLLLEGKVTSFTGTPLRLKTTLHTSSLKAHLSAHRTCLIPLIVSPEMALSFLTRI